MTRSRLSTIASLLIALQTTAESISPTAVSPELSVTVSDQGQVAFEADHIHELSGIDYMGKDDYVVVSDKGGEIAYATIKIDRETGEIVSSEIKKTIHRFHGRKDVEAVVKAWDNTLIVTDEAKPGIYLHDYGSGVEIDRFEVPKVFEQQRPNRGFESLSLTHRGGGAIWAANEEALKPDGPASSAEGGTLIRLQRFSFDFDGQPIAQFAYRVDPHRGADNIIKRAQSGVSGIVALGPHRLIVMERELGGAPIPTFRTRLYLIDTKGATDTSKIESLNKDNTAPVRKQLLFESNTGATNFEGITLGPKLDNGDYVLVLVSDNGGGKLNPQNLLSLRIAREPVEGTKDD